MLSILDLFRIGIGPSSSHTVGPIRIAARFINDVKETGLLAEVASIDVELQGSLAFTGVGHGTPKAVVLGLLGLDPETLNPESADVQYELVQSSGLLTLPDGHSIPFDCGKQIRLAYDIAPALHPNGMRLRALRSDACVLADATWYSTGGGFIASQKQLERPVPDDVIKSGSPVPFPFFSAAELLETTRMHDLRIDEIVFRNECATRSAEAVNDLIDRIVQVMMDCIARGLTRTGLLPGGLKVRRRAPEIWARLLSGGSSNEREQLFDWLNVYAMAVNEENAAGGQVVTAPTNGAAGIIPAVIRHYCWDTEDRTERTRRFLLTAGAIGLLYKQRASISGAEMGCQGEVGVACSMAAGALAAVWGATPQQVCNAAEIAMEHNLGLTCDPVGGLVQIPCIERNAIGTVKAANAARLALHSHEKGKVTLDQVIETMRQTGFDMSSKYKETSQGGLAVNVVAC